MRGQYSFSVQEKKWMVVQYIRHLYDGKHRLYKLHSDLERGIQLDKDVKVREL